MSNTKNTNKMLLVQMVPFSGEYRLISKHASMKAAMRALKKTAFGNPAIISEKSAALLTRIN